MSAVGIGIIGGPYSRGSSMVSDFRITQKLIGSLTGAED